MRELNANEVANVSGGFLCCFIIKKIISSHCRPRPSYPQPPVKPQPPVVNP